LKLLRGKRTRLEKTRRLFFHLCGVHSPLYQRASSLLLHCFLFSFFSSFSLLPPVKKEERGGFGGDELEGIGKMDSRVPREGIWRRITNASASIRGTVCRKGGRNLPLLHARGTKLVGQRPCLFSPFCFGRRCWKTWALLTHLLFFLLPCPGLRSFFIKHLGDSSPFGDFVLAPIFFRSSSPPVSLPFRG
jgi:hypothetical protein